MQKDIVNKKCRKKITANFWTAKRNSGRVCLLKGGISSKSLKDAGFFKMKRGLKIEKPLFLEDAGFALQSIPDNFSLQIRFNFRNRNQIDFYLPGSSVPRFMISM